MLFDRGPVPEAIELDAQFGLELFHQLEHELEESFSQTQPFSQEVLSQPQAQVLSEDAGLWPRPWWFADDSGARARTACTGAGSFSGRPSWLVPDRRTPPQRRDWRQ